MKHSQMQEAHYASSYSFFPSCLSFFSFDTFAFFSSLRLSHFTSLPSLHLLTFDWYKKCSLKSNFFLRHWCSFCIYSTVIQLLALSEHLLCMKEREREKTREQKQRRNVIQLSTLFFITCYLLCKCRHFLLVFFYKFRPLSVCLSFLLLVTAFHFTWNILSLSFVALSAFVTKTTITSEHEHSLLRIADYTRVTRCNKMFASFSFHRTIPK